MAGAAWEEELMYLKSLCERIAERRQRVMINIKELLAGTKDRKLWKVIIARGLKTDVI